MPPPGSRSARFADSLARSRWPVRGLTLALAAMAALWGLKVADRLSPGAPSATPTVETIDVRFGATTLRLEASAVRAASDPARGPELAYRWPGLEPAGADGRIGEILLITFEPAEDAAAARMLREQIFPRFLSEGSEPGPAGLVLRRFRPDTRYAGQWLVTDPAAPTLFARCADGDSTLIPATCEMTRPVTAAISVTVRFPRTALAQWHALNGFVGSTARTALDGAPRHNR